MSIKTLEMNWLNAHSGLQTWSFWVTKGSYLSDRQPLEAINRVRVYINAQFPSLMAETNPSSDGLSGRISINYLQLKNLVMEEARKKLYTFLTSEKFLSSVEMRNKVYDCIGISFGKDRSSVCCLSVLLGVTSRKRPELILELSIPGYAVPGTESLRLYSRTTLNKQQVQSLLDIFSQG